MSLLGNKTSSSMNPLERIFYFVGLVLVTAYHTIIPSPEIKGIENEITVIESPTPPLPNPTHPAWEIKSPTINPDPIVSCTISKECGGGEKQFKKSQCENSTCCGVGSTWIFVESLQKCKDLQSQTQSTATYHDYSKDVQQFSNQTPYPTFPPYVSPTKNPQASLDCQHTVMEWYREQIRLCNDRGTGKTGSARTWAIESCLDPYTRQKDERLSKC